MINKLINHKESIFSFVFMYLNNAINYIVPLLVIPYIIKTLGIDNYGYFIFAFSFASYFKIIIDFGFDITLTKQIILYKDDNEKLSSIFSFVFYSRLLLSIFSILLYSLILYFTPISNGIGIEIFYYNFFYVLSSLFNVTAFYYAFKHIKFITISNAVFKLLYFVSLVIFVDGESDLGLTVFFSSLSWFLPSVVLTLIALKKYSLRFKLTGLKSELNREILEESKYAFISNIAVSLYGTTNVFLLGLYSPGAVTGIYGGIEKIYKAITTIISSSNFVLYPILIEKYKKHKDSFMKSLRSIELIYLLISSIMVIVLYFSESFVFNYLFNDNYNEYAHVMYCIFIVGLIFSPYGALYTRVFIIMNYSKKLLKITGIGFFVNAAVLMLTLFFKRYDLVPLSILVTQIHILVSKRLLINKGIYAAK